MAEELDAKVVSTRQATQWPLSSVRGSPDGRRFDETGRLIRAFTAAATLISAPRTTDATRYRKTCSNEGIDQRGTGASTAGSWAALELFDMEPAAAGIVETTVLHRPIASVLHRPTASRRYASFSSRSQRRSARKLPNVLAHHVCAERYVRKLAWR